MAALNCGGIFVSYSGVQSGTWLIFFSKVGRNVGPKKWSGRNIYCRLFFLSWTRLQLKPFAPVDVELGSPNGIQAEMICEPLAAK